MPGVKEERVAAAVLRGVRRLLGAMGYSSVCELSLPNGSRADVAAISGSGQILIVEIKSSAADFRSDQKWPEYRDYCDQLYFAVAPEGPIELIPNDTGLIVADSYFGELVRTAPRAAVIPARRRAVLLAFACHAADRLHAIQDPQRTEGFR
jgi:hypothetical protein